MMAKTMTILFLVFGLAKHGAAQNLATEYLTSCKKLLTAHVELNPLSINPHVKEMEDLMMADVIGQDEGVHVLAEGITTSMVGLQDINKPIGRVLMTGPTGTGKTQSVKALIKSLGGDPDFHLIRIDCGEFQMGHEISRIQGATASYAGYGDKPMLHPEELAKRKLKIKKPNGETIDVNFILFDEIEKCHDLVFNLMLGILDNGKITMGDNTESFFRNSFIFGTSNLGAKEVEQLIEAKQAHLKTLSPDILQRYGPGELDLTGRYDLQLREEIGQVQKAALRRRFKPEFINRWQDVIQYLHLSQAEFSRILGKQLAELQIRIFENAMVKVDLSFSKAAEEHIVSLGTSFLNGARELDRILESEVRRPLARLMSSSQIDNGDVLYIDVADRDAGPTLQWTVIGRGLARPELAELADKIYPNFNMQKVEFDKVRKTETAQKPQTFADELQQYPRVLSGMWADAGKKTMVPVERNITTGGTVQILVKYGRIGNDLYRIEMKPDKSIQLVRSAEILPHLQAKFPEDQIYRWDEKDLRARISLEEKRSEKGK
jgi:hypothetical protein